MSLVALARFGLRARFPRPCCWVSACAFFGCWGRVLRAGCAQPHRRWPFIACFVAWAPRVLGGWRSRARAAPCGCAGLPASGTRRPGPPPTPAGRRACVRRPPCMRGGPCFAACPPRFVVFWVCGFALGLGGGCVPRWRGPRGRAAGVAPYCALVAQLPCSPHAFVRRLCLLALLWPSLRPPLRAPLRRSSVVLCLGGPWAPGGPAAAG